MSKTCEIRCQHCRNWIPAEIQFGDAESFFGTHMSGNQQQCSVCGRMTGMNKENMRFVERRDDGRVTIQEGEDTF